MNMIIKDHIKKIYAFHHTYKGTASLDFGRTSLLLVLLTLLELTLLLFARLSDWSSIRFDLFGDDDDSIFDEVHWLKLLCTCIYT
jgi:hypothetical protein